MLRLRSLPVNLPRLLTLPQRLLSSIGRKPKTQVWFPAASEAAADVGKNLAALSCSHGSSRSSSSSSSSSGISSSLRRSPVCASTSQQPEAPTSDLLQPQPAGSFNVTAKELAGKGKVRLDAYLASQLPDASRAKISASIKAGLIVINRAVVSKPSYAVKAGDHITAVLLPPEPCSAIPEDIPLDVVYEDDFLIVVNKVPGMVVHLSPGHTTGTLVNALLAHCGLPACDAIPCGSNGSNGSSGNSGGGLYSGQAGLVLGGVLQDDDLDEAEDEDQHGGLGLDIDATAADTEAAAVAGPDSSAGHQEREAGAGLGSTRSSSSARSTQSSVGAAVSGNSNSSSNNSSSSPGKGIIRPGIVHRLDRGTSGLMVVAKTDAVHAALCQQFKERSVSRIYNSITVGVPSPAAARVATNIVRDPSNRLRMMAVPYGSGRGRTAASNYTTLQVVAGGGAAVVQWKLETGRTHQIRVHAKHIGHPLLGDDMYGPNHAASSRQVIGKRSSLAAAAKAAVEGFGRPALHAKTLGFTHPVTRQRLEFDSEWPADFKQLYTSLQEWL